VLVKDELSEVPTLNFSFGSISGEAAVDAGPLKASKDELKNVKKQIISKCTELGGTKNEELMTAIKNVVPSGNPNAIKDLNVANELLSNLATIKPLQ
jgi:hypothetical protein